MQSRIRAIEAPRRSTLSMHRSSTGTEAGEGDAARRVLLTKGCSTSGPNPNLDELLAWLGAVDEYGPPFEALWASEPFGCVLQAAVAFADSYQG